MPKKKKIAHPRTNQNSLVASIKSGGNRAPAPGITGAA
jgi:hypothetical protein